MHDDLIASCATLARSLHTELNAANMAEKTLGLCDWEQLGHFCRRDSLPFDTAPAMLSRYAFVLNIHGQVSVSPMRALWELKGYVRVAFVLIEEIRLCFGDQFIIMVGTHK
jgi:hypothetical protein